MSLRGRATLKEVAARAEVSTATVSNVFSGRKPVRPELRARVEEAAKALSYQVDRAASQLRSGRAKVLGVLVPDLDDTFFTSLISHLEVLARAGGYDRQFRSGRDRDPSSPQQGPLGRRTRRFPSRHRTHPRARPWRDRGGASAGSA